MPVWNKANAQHLLSRCLFGFNRQDVTYALSKSLNDFVDNDILGATVQPTAPDTWVSEKPVSNNSTVDRQREKELSIWWLKLMLNQGTSIREKMVLFWHNHFVSEISKVNYPQLMYGQQKLFRDYAIGNFKELTTKVTTDPAMLIYLDGVQNQKSAPNENYGRELMELFTLSIGNYTETDIKQAARALTGWQIDSTTGITSIFNGARFDDTAKTFLGETGNFGYQEIINIIFKKEVCAQFVCRKLYHEFVFYQPDEAFITQMAAVFRTNNYDVKSVLSFLFKSDYFYQSQFIGAKIKEPVAVLIGALKQLELINGDGNYYSYLIDMYKQLQQYLLDPPDVRGWEGQRKWISSTTLPQRNSFTDSLISGKKLNGQTLNQNLSAVTYSRTFSTSEDAAKFTDDVIALMIQFPVSSTRRQLLIDTLLDGSAQYDYSTYSANAELRIQKFFKALMRLSEYQLS